MKYVLVPQEMKRYETGLIQRGFPSIVLMENAAANMARIIAKENDPCGVLLLCGRGNNGGDGFAAARHLKKDGFNVQVAVLGDSEMSIDAKINAEACRAFCIPITACSTQADFAGIQKHFQPDIIVDAMFGTGLNRDLEGLFLTAAEFVNAHRAKVYSADIPSGIDGSTGAVLGKAVRADVTVTFQYAKAGHYLYPGREYAGRLEVVDIGVPYEPFPMRVLEQPDLYEMIPKRRADTHKGDYGRVALIAGSAMMLGAAAICARAALRAGCGLLTAGLPYDCMMAFHTMCQEAMAFPLPQKNGMIDEGSLCALETLTGKMDAVIFGPGIGKAPGAGEILEFLLTQSKLPLVIDADGLNALCGKLHLLGRNDVVVTPHPGEMARLMACSIGDVNSNMLKYAQTFAQEYHTVTVLKGAVTVIASPDGHVTFNERGNPALAKGGSGDVLSGIIGALLARGLKPYDAACLGCYILGCAGDILRDLRGENGVLASEVADCIGNVMEP
ncbi:MAG: NAD(P)H-hydrate dehydratase [Christensenellales bacterium]